MARQSDSFRLEDGVIVQQKNFFLRVNGGDCLQIIGAVIYHRRNVITSFLEMAYSGDLGR
jgi:hypothetical protein